MASSSSATIAVSDPSLPKYDVFISFRGEDTRKGFTSHLHSALCEKQITAYIDQLNLEKGDTISPALLQAIEGSAISIIVFSENYASSRWCLDELVHILKCKEKKNRIVLPIFYGVDPSHIRKQEESYAKAFLNHEQRFRDRMEKVQEWKQALTKAANLSGWDSREESDESILVKKVVERVREKLVPIWSIDDLKQGFVGIHPRLVTIEALLHVVDIVGICGMGGIGKTTLASAVFKRLSNQFEGSYFAANVREESNKKGFPNFANEVFSKLLKEEDIDMYTSEVDVRLCRKKLLLVLDDVDTSEQLQHLVGDRQFGHGSKIIITSRDKQVLKPIVGDNIYEAEELNSDDAHQLFYLKAFRSNACPTEFREISEKVVRKATGNPLALQTLGSYLYSRKIEEWESALDKLKRTPHRDIQKVLEISYDGLDVVQKDIFLDIACFLKDENRGFVEGILEDKSIIGITDLVDKSLVTIDQDGIIRMHDLIQEMGWEIVRRSTKNLGERSRLWIAQEVCELLKRKKGTEATEGIYLDVREIEELQLRPDVFEEMCNLRFLKIFGFVDTINKYKVYFTGDLQYLSDSLRYLHWDFYPQKSLPSNFNPQNLVQLHMCDSKLEQLWDEVKNCRSLKGIDLSGSYHLTKIPDLSFATKLEWINLSWCRNLKTIPKLSGNLRRLQLDGSGIEQIPSSSIECLSSLSNLSLRGCRSLESLPSNIGTLKALKYFTLHGTAIRELPSSFENLTGLSSLALGACRHLEELPASICKLTRLVFLDFYCFHAKLTKLPPMLSGLCSLTVLNLNGRKIREIPDCLGSLTSLRSLGLSRNCFERIPSSIGKLCKLRRLDISGCKNLQSLPELPLFIEELRANDCSSLEMVSTSRYPLTRERWLDNYDCSGESFCREFSFHSCSKLDENAINTIFYEFRSTVFRTATAPEEVVKSKLQAERYRLADVEVAKWKRRKVAVDYPSHEIPEWFNYQSEGSSITIKLPPDGYNPKTFLGIVASVLGEEDCYDELVSYGRFRCMLYLKTEHSKNLEVDLSGSVDGTTKYSGLDHVSMWYIYFNHSEVNFQEYQEAKFEFSGVLRDKVKRCGVRMLHLEAAVNGDYISDSPRYLHCDFYPEKSLPSNFNPQNLVELHMCYSKLEQLCDEVKNCRSLMRINLSGSDHLTKIPDLSLATKLESINLSWCRNLKTIPKLSGNLQELLLDHSGIEQIPDSSIECLSGLRKLCLKGCRSLESLPSNIWRLKALEEINLRACIKLTNLPQIENQLEHLQILDLRETAIRELPSSVENLTGLYRLHLGFCRHLEELPPSICKLTRLVVLDLHCCAPSKYTKFPPMSSGLCSLTELHLGGRNIREIPDGLGSLTSLVTLCLYRNDFERIPSSIGKLCKLKTLDISNCKNLQSLPELPLSIERLNANDCSSLEMVSTSRYPLTRERWLDNYDCSGESFCREFSFHNCSKLDENAINTIFYEFLSTVFRTATAPDEVVKSKYRRKDIELLM